MRLTYRLLGIALGLAACALPSCATDRSDDDSRLAEAAASDRAATLVFDPDADVTTAEHFYDLPFPSDVRTTPGGAPDWTGFPRPSSHNLDGLLARAAQRKGHSVVTTAYFRLDGSLHPLDGKTPMPGSTQSPVLLVDVHSGVLYPTVAETLGNERSPSIYLPHPLLAVAPAPGVVLPAKRTFAYVVRRELGGSGHPLAVDARFATLARGLNPGGTRGAATLRSLTPLWAALDALHVDRASIAGATVFGTDDQVAELGALTDATTARYSTEITPRGVEGIPTSRYCPIGASAKAMPQFRRGAAPFDTEGQFQTDAGGDPIQQGAQNVPLTISIPSTPMPPGGYPVVLYLHGSGGTSRQALDRGPTGPDGQPVAGRGPAWVYARKGIAVIGVALPLNPERAPGASSHAYLPLGNLAAYPDHFRQGAIELRLLVKALHGLRVNSVAPCSGPTVPTGGIKFDAENVYLHGQSHGSAFAYMVGALEPKINGAILSGAGGDWPLVATLVKVGGIFSTKELLGQFFLSSPDLSGRLHPALALISAAWEVSEPLVYAPRLAERPLPGRAARSFFLPVGAGDSDFPEPVYDAMALALGARQAVIDGPVWPSMQASLAMENHGGTLHLPTAATFASPGGAFAGYVEQWPRQPNSDGPKQHSIFSEVEPLKHQIACFVSTLHTRGTPTLVAPGPEDSASCD